jgi:hypothetical protein
MAFHSPPAGRRGRGCGLGRRRFRPARLVLPALALAAAGAFAAWVSWDNARRLREAEGERAVRTAERARLFARGEFAPIFALCRDGWREELSFYHLPSALAWTRTSLDGYFLEGVDQGSWRPLHCDAEGVRRGARVVRPLVELLPAEAVPGADSAAWEVWEQALNDQAAARLGAGLLAVELLPHPLTGVVIARRWHGVEGGARPTLEPAGAPPFPALIGASRRFAMAPGTAPPALRPLPRHRWGKEPDAAFAVVEGALPPGASVVELDFQQDSIEVSIDWPTPAFDGDPPAPYGDLDFDEHGLPSRDWWYPRTDPGFGCAKGRPLAELRAAYAAAIARVPKGASSRAWYSCSPAYGDGHQGAWHLFVG